MESYINITDFQKVEVRTGKIISAKINEKARKPSYIMKIDFGPEFGIKGSSAQLTENYTVEDLIDTQIIAVMNFPPMRIAGFKSEVLVLAIVCSDNGTVLVRPDKIVANGEKLA